MPTPDDGADKNSARWRAPLAALGQALADLLYPPHCAGCGCPGVLLCDACRARIAYIRPPVCPRCARQTAGAGLCSLCRRTASPIDAIVSVAYFTPPLRPAIHAFKYQGVRTLARPLAELMAGTWPPSGNAPDLLLAVPLHTARERQRGYNQAILLADELARLGSVRRSDGLVQRGRETRPQVGLGWKERRQNVEGAFTCTGDVRGSRIVLVDDVCTTGATLEACAAALREGGARSVVGFTLARAGIEEG